MLIGEPPPTQADLNFQIFGIPVRVHPFFWIVGLLLGASGGQAEPIRVFLWVGALFVSILIHELGHAFAARWHGWRPWIVLYGMGGLASYNPTYHTPRSKILISLAGPGAGFLFAAVIVAGIAAAGHLRGFALDFMPIRFYDFESDRLNDFIDGLLFINIFWGLINLLPVYPLDGGQIAREILTELSPYQGVRHSLILSMITGGALALFAATLGEFFIALLFGYLAYMSYAALQAFTGGGGGRSW